MPLYKEIMFEKIENKNDYKLPSCCTYFYLTDQNKQTKKTQQMKNPSNQPKTHFTACADSLRRVLLSLQSLLAVPSPAY